MSVVFKLKLGDASSGVFVGDNFLPRASPQTEEALQSGLSSSADGSNLAPCPHCGVANGASALACWNCEAGLAVAVPFRTVAGLVDAGEESEDPKQQAAADDEFRINLTSVSRDGYFESFGVPGGPAAPTEIPDARPQTDTGSLFHEAPSAFESTDPAAAPSIPAAVATKRTREIVAAIVLASLVGAWAYPHFRAPQDDTFDVPLAPDSSRRSNGTVLLPASVTPTNADPTQTASTNSIPPEGASRTADEALAAATRALAVEPSARSIVEAERPATAPTDRQVGVVTRSATAGALTPTYHGKARGAMRSADVTSVGSTREPVRPEPAQQVPASVGPCTATVVALGLCTAPPIQSKE
jgi:hypothetical protein